MVATWGETSGLGSEPSPAPKTVLTIKMGIGPQLVTTYVAPADYRGERRSEGVPRILELLGWTNRFLGGDATV